MENPGNPTATGKSSGVKLDLMPQELLKFMMVPVGAISLPETLHDQRLAIDEKSLTFFLPLIVWKRGDVYSIIDGCKRFLSLAAQDRKECACGVIESDFDETKAGLLRIALNSARELHLREKLLFVRWLKTSIDTGAYRAQMQKLGLAANERHELELLLDCSGKLVEAVHCGTLDPSVAPEMVHLNDTDVAAVLDLFQTIPFSRQMQRELVEWLHEIAFTGRSTIRELLASKDFSEVLSAPKLNLPQKAARLHETAHALRFPLYAGTKKLWTENARKVNPDPASVSFQPGPFFEKRGLEVRVKVNNAESAGRLMEKLAQIKVDEWQRLIDPTEFLSVGPG